MCVSPELTLDARLRLLQMHYESRVGHIGGNLSCLDVLLSLYHCVLRPEDYFVLSKGHAAGALYVALWSVGLLQDDDLRQFHKDGTRLSGHPPVRGIAQIPFATGSLGHGLGLAAGLALGKKFRKEPGRVFCLTSDGEWNEGSTWEALIFIAHRQLDNLTILIDLNGMQGFGPTSEIAALDPMKEKLQTFGVHTVEINGHDTGELVAALSQTGAGTRAIIANTVKGHGVSFMEGRFEWHYKPLTEDLYERARQDLIYTHQLKASA